jgi:hypothetical protein
VAPVERDGLLGSQAGVGQDGDQRGVEGVELRADCLDGGRRERRGGLARALSGLVDDGDRVELHAAVDHCLLTDGLEDGQRLDHGGCSDFPLELHAEVGDDRRGELAQPAGADAGFEVLLPQADVDVAGSGRQVRDGVEAPPLLHELPERLAAGVEVGDACALDATADVVAEVRRIGLAIKRAATTPAAFAPANLTAPVRLAVDVHAAHPLTSSSIALRAARVPRGERLRAGAGDDAGAEGRVLLPMRRSAR